jgi:adenylate cyclase
MPVRVSQYWTFQPNAGDMPSFPVMALQLYALDGYGAFRKLLHKVNAEQAAQTPPDARRAINDIGAGKFIRRVRQIVRDTAQVREELIRTNKTAADENPSRNALVHLYTSQSRPYLNFYGPAQSVTSVPYYQALRIGTQEADAPVLDVRGKAIFIGLSERELAEARDNFHTVYSKARVFLTGVEIAATAFLNLLTNTPVRPANAGEQFFVLLLWGTIIGVICRVSPPLVGGISVLLCAGAYLFAATSEFRANATWFPIVVPLFIQTSFGYFGLGYYLPEELVTQVARDRIDIRKYGQTVYGACLFADVAGYTPVSEALSPRDLSELMHKYLEASFEPVHRNGGLIVELNGDSILALWKGEPDDSSFRSKACAAALEMEKAVRRFNESNPAVTLPTRISIHAGPIYIGNIGAGSHYEYGITGDTVTTAARLDGLNKHLSTKILVSAEVMQNLDGFLARRCGSFIMKGKTHPVEAYELICRSTECTSSQRTACAMFAEAQSAFEARRWDEASQKFQQTELVLNGDELSRFYLKLGTHHRANPPAQDWNGTIVMDEK